MKIKQNTKNCKESKELTKMNLNSIEEKNQFRGIQETQMTKIQLNSIELKLIWKNSS